MKITEHNQFYTSVSKYYSEIFPYNPIQLKFVQTIVGDLKNKQFLDIGCATGELANQLANDGAKVIGIDLNEDLLENARANKNHSGLKFQVGDMLNLKSDFQPQQFDSVLCFGNTLVHLTETGLIRKMLSGVFLVLKPGGNFLLQILNYDYIVDKEISELPLIETESIKFVRKYKFKANNPVIRFKTDLHIKIEGKTISNETGLLALKSTELVDLLKTIGFKRIELFSNFKKDPFGGDHLPLVLKCVK